MFFPNLSADESLLHKGEGIFGPFMISKARMAAKCMKKQINNVEVLHE